MHCHVPTSLNLTWTPGPNGCLQDRATNTIDLGGLDPVVRSAWSEFCGRGLSVLRLVFLKTSQSSICWTSILDMAECADFEAETIVSEEEKLSLIGNDVGQEHPHKANLWTTIFVVSTTLLLACSIAFYVFMYLKAPSDSACERLNWAWSK